MGSERKGGSGMQITLLSSIIILVSVFPTQQKNLDTRNQRKMPVEVWCVGDDLFSQGMCQALFSAFESTPEFDWLDENKPGNLIITIPENVGWKKVGKRTKVSYSVEFSTFDDRVFMTRKGWCWQQEYATCAHQIFQHARVAASKLRAGH
jgi:hypothetical protein